MAHNHFAELNHRIESVAGTLHDALEASLQTPSQLDPVMQKFVPTLCMAQSSCSDQNLTALHYLGVFQPQEGYYIHFLDLSGQLLASGGQIPTHFPVSMGTEQWQTFTAPDGTRYRQLSIKLKMVDQAAWGYMQVGRSLHNVDN